MTTLRSAAIAAFLLVSSSALAASGVTISPDGACVVVQKDVGGLRWAIVRNVDDGSVVGNVFDPAGGPAQFVWCSQVSESGGTIVFSCFGGSACTSGDCKQQWDPLGPVTLPASFFAAGNGPTPTPGPRPTPTPPPASAAQVRYGNDLVCNGAGFTSTLSVNGFRWVSFSGVFSPYQSVNRTSLGPTFIETNNSVCADAQFSGTFFITPGRRYAIIQTLNDSGERILGEVDEGSAQTAEALADDALISSLGTLAFDAVIPAIEIGKTGELATVPR